MVFSLFFLSLFSLTIQHTTTALSASDYTKLIYKGCAHQTFQDPTYTLNLKTLFSSLTTNSNSKPFYITTQNQITGLYQCRGDLTTPECSACVAKTTNMVSTLCDDNVIAARIQLNGCYLRYEVVGFKQVPLTELLYNVCGKKMVGDGDFVGRRDSAFEMLESGVKGANGMFYAGSFEEVYVLGQCEGDLSVADCGDCVKSAIEDVKSQCGEDSSSAQVFLHKCFVSYSYYPRGVGDMPTTSSGSGPQHTQRTVAIAVGGVAALGFLIVCLMCLKSVMKRKKSSKSGDWW